MLTNFIRNVARLGLWFVFTALCVGLAYMTISANYLACKSAFELSGYEKQRLIQDDGLGAIIGAFMPQATLAHLYAWLIAAGLALGLFITTHCLFHIYHLYEDRRSYLRAGDQDSTRIALELMVRNLLYVLALVVPLISLINWDIELFRYRSLAALLGIDNPDIAPKSIPSWDIVERDYGHLAAARISLQSGAYGYLGGTAALCIALEVCLSKLNQAWVQLASPVDQGIERWIGRGDAASPMNLHGYDEQGLPVYDPHAPLAYGPEGVPLHPIGRIEGNEAPTDAPNENTSAVTAYAQSEPADGIVTAADGIPPREARADGVAEPTQANPSRSVDVIGAQPAEQVTFSVALANPERYRVDQDTHQVWDRTYWNLLHDTETVSRSPTPLAERNAA